MQFKDLILVPALITLCVTVLRLAGELMEGPELLFGRGAGGGGALVGIFWLVPIFGIYFAKKLTEHQMLPASQGGAWLRVLAAVALFVVNGAVLAMLEVPFPWSFLAVGAVSLLGIWVVVPGWREMAGALIAYGLAARIPVVIVTALALAFSWETHYNAPAPGVPEMGGLATFFWIGLFPQLTLWIAFTVVFGTLFGLIALPLWRRSR